MRECRDRSGKGIVSKGVMILTFREKKKRRAIPQWIRFRWNGSEYYIGM